VIKATLQISLETLRHSRSGNGDELMQIAGDKGRFNDKKSGDTEASPP